MRRNFVESGWGNDRDEESPFKVQFLPPMIRPGASFRKRLASPMQSHLLGVGRMMGVKRSL